MYVCTCVLNKDMWLRPLLFLPPTSHSQSVNPSCCLMLEKPTTHSHTLTHSSEANMTKVDPPKLHHGPLKSSRGSWWNTSQLPVIQPCRTEWPKWPPGATVTKLNVLLSVLPFSVVSLARSLSFSSSSSTDELCNEISPQLTIEALLSHLWGNLVTDHCDCQHLLHLSVQTDLLPPSSLPSSPAGIVVLSSFCPLFCSPSLIYCELISKVVSPLSLKIRFSFLSSFL